MHLSAPFFIFTVPKLKESTDILISHIWNNIICLFLDCQRLFLVRKVIKKVQVKLFFWVNWIFAWIILLVKIIKSNMLKIMGASQWRWKNFCSNNFFVNIKIYFYLKLFSLEPFSWSHWKVTIKIRSCLCVVKFSFIT